MPFQPGHIERRYIEVPLGASWVEATIQTSGFDTTRRFFVDAVQICPLQRPQKWESVATFSSPAAKSVAFPAVAGQTMELAIAQFWSSGIGSHESTIVEFEVVFHGININKEEVVLDGSEAPSRIDAEALLASEKLAPAALLNKLKIPYRPIDSKLCTLATNRDNLPSGKQILALALTYKFKLEDATEVKPQIPLLNNRVYDTKFESQFYMIYDTNRRIYAMGDVYPIFSKLPKGEYNLQLYQHDNVQYLEKLKQLVLFTERNLEEKDVIRLNFFSQPDGPVMGNSTFKTSVLVPGKKESIYLGPPSKDKLPKSEYPKYTPLLAKILEGLLSQSNVEDKIHHDEEVIDSANEVVDSIDREELAKFISLKSDPEDEEAEKNKKKMEITRDQLAEALYEKGLALADIESLKGQEASSLASSKDLEITRDQSQPEFGVQPDLFEENFKELKKWVNLKSSKYGTLYVRDVVEGLEQH
ncbi:tripeptidyl-peptidase 2-like [Castanea sativa]|uniref:tripeptidyl-peptidase 2-like n=1 Tax=Castanea sativa TaxID=21020 RepID=UPI003F64E0A1